MRTNLRVVVLFLLLSLSVSAALAVPPQFESHQVHPMQVIGDQLVAVNTPDNRLSVFEWQGDTPVLVREIRVGLEPVSVAVHGRFAWVVNTLSDDISIVDVLNGTMVHTILTGDEPQDIAFVQDSHNVDGRWAAVSLSQENRVAFYQTVWPYSEMASVDIVGSDPRALRATPDGTSLWVAVFESGSHSTMARRDIVKDPAGPYGGQEPPFDPPVNKTPPPNLMSDNGLLLKNVNGQWLDEYGGDWSNLITWDLYDNDLVRIDVTATPSVGATISNVGTLIEDIVIDEESGDVWALNTEAFNHVLFEQKLKGKFVETQATLIPNGNGSPVKFRINADLPAPLPLPPVATAVPIDDVDPVPIPVTDALAVPTEVLISDISGASEMYVTGMGNEVLVVMSPASGGVNRELTVPMGLTGLAAHGRTGQLIGLNRFQNTLHLIDPATGDTGVTIPVGRSGFDPTPANIAAGRKFLYTGQNSKHGDLACASCHPYGNMDNIAWDLGDPTDPVLVQLDPALNGGVVVAPFHANKGPMTTQSLRGMKDTGRLHWRGDREDFIAFNPAFETLLGGFELPAGDMQLFEDFILALEYPPNPFRGIDESMSWFKGGDPVNGEDLYNQFCVNCHSFPAGTNATVLPIEILVGFGNQPQKTPHQRNLYEKTGFDDLNGMNVRGHGYLHDGMDHNLDDFLDFFALPAQDERDLEAFLMNFPTGSPAALGAQVTFTGNDLDLVLLAIRLQQMVVAADSREVDLVAHAVINGEERGFFKMPNGWHANRIGEWWDESDLLDIPLNHNTPVTFTCVPAGEGVRMGIDRDQDGGFDGDELDQGTDPADPNNIPTAVEDPAFGGDLRLSRVTSIFPAPFSDRTSVELYLPQDADARVDVFDMRGRRVKTLKTGTLRAGVNRLEWNGRDDAGMETAAGTYFVQLRIGEHRDTRKVTYVK